MRAGHRTITVSNLQKIPKKTATSARLAASQTKQHMKRKQAAFSTHKQNPLPPSQEATPSLAASTSQTPAVTIGKTVYLEIGENTLAYIIIETKNLNPLAECISASSPLGRTLLGKHLGDTIICKTPMGKFQFIVGHIE
jgi:transcription elongation GreA/GreB family factor